MIADPHPSHGLGFGDESRRCSDCEAPYGSPKAAKPCPVFVDRATGQIRGLAASLLASLPLAPIPPSADAPFGDHKRHAVDSETWTVDLNVREAVCRSAARCLGVPVDAEATLPQMSRLGQ